ncbi:MAG: hypothetical protein NPINA01_10850 [Nitrospinaceae bacterium]|nr:MAG: hypothetical protein NPINA01_10850 [Nitrospinaceae bacterium]
MNSLSFRWVICAPSAMVLAIVVVFLLTPDAGMGKVLDDNGEPVILPNILREPNEQGPACSNASVWQDWIKHKVSRVTPGYEKVAEKLKKVSETFDCHGKRIVWQGALIQSILETGYFRFEGDADPEKFNIAGVGITLTTDKSEQEDFGNLEDGIKAYYQHLCLYATSKRVKNLIAERTKTMSSEKINIIKGFIKKDPLRAITFNDLKADFPTGMNKKFNATNASEKFINFAKKWVGVKKNATNAQIIAAWNKKWDQHDETGGTTFTWAGDPFYGIKMMSLFADGTKWVEDRCQEASDQESDQKKAEWVLQSQSSEGEKPLIGKHTVKDLCVTDYTMLREKWESKTTQLTYEWEQWVTKTGGCKKGKPKNLKRKYWKKWVYTFNAPPGKLSVRQKLDPIKVNGVFTFGDEWTGAASASLVVGTFNYASGPPDWLLPSEKNRRGGGSKARVGKGKESDSITYNLKPPESDWPDEIWIKFYMGAGHGAYVQWLYEKQN